MYRYEGAENIDQYFLSRQERKPRTVYMTYCSGYDGRGLEFLSHYYYESRKCGLYIRTTIANPVESEVRYFFQTLGEGFSMSAEWFAGQMGLWEPKLSPNQRQLTGEAMHQTLRLLEERGTAGNILKNTYVKYMCWLRYKYEVLLYQLEGETIPRVLYEGSPGKYEVYFLQLLAMCGCDVVITDPEGTGSPEKFREMAGAAGTVTWEQKGKPPEHFTKIDWKKKEEEQARRNQFRSLDQVVSTNQWVKGEALDSLTLEPSKRGADTRHVYNLFLQYQGTDHPEQYENKLFYIKEKLVRNGSSLVLAQGRLEAPDVEEVNQVRRVGAATPEELIAGLRDQIHPSQEEFCNLLARKAFTELLEEENQEHLGRLNNKGIMLVCWLNRYGRQLFARPWQERMPVFLFYGAYNQNEALFFRLLAGLPVDVVIFSPDLAVPLPMEDSRLLKKTFSKSMTAGRFPEKEKKVQAATVAYEAERELDTLLYQDTGLFRPNQFMKSTPVTLKTTCEEIGIYWKQEAKYRPFFEAGDQRVRVPVIFAKISGVKDGNVRAYWQEIESRLTDNTLLITQLPRLRDTDPNPVKPHVVSFFRNGKLLVDKIKNHSSYQYDYLSEKTQNYILDKIQELIELDWIRYSGQGIQYTILAVLLNLDKNVVRLIQKFDFTGEIPKLIIVNVKEEMCSLEDTIYTAFLNLVGFDIILYVPTGYRTIEKYLKEDIMEEHQAGEYLFDLTVPRLRIPSGRGTSQSIFSKLFREG